MKGNGPGHGRTFNRHEFSFLCFYDLTKTPAAVSLHELPSLSELSYEHKTKTKTLPKRSCLELNSQEFLLCNDFTEFIMLSFSKTNIQTFCVVHIISCLLK